MNDAKNSTTETNTARELNMSIRNIVFIGMVGLIGLSLSACESDKGTTLQDSLTDDNTANENTVVSNLDYGAMPAPVIPFPNNILFLENGAPPADGTLNIPVVDPTNLADPAVGMNALDGFSTGAPISTGFTGALNAASFPTSVRVYEVSLTGGAVTSVERELTYGVEFVAALSSVDTTNSTLVIVPLQPLKPKQAYMPVITTTLKSADGGAVGPSSSYAITHGLTPLHTNGISNTPLLTDEQAQQLEPLRQATVAAESALNAFDGTKSTDIVISWNFTTQSTTDVLAIVREQVRALIANASVNPVSPMATPLGAGDVYFGTLDVPYFLERSDTSTSPSNDPTALFSCWEGAGAGGLGNCAAGPHVTQYNPVPTLKSTETIPLIVTVPDPTVVTNCVKPAGGWPVVIFQHGITRNRGHVLAVSDSLAQACMAAVAIDIPMHGVAGTETDGTAPLRIPGLERHFDLDLLTQDANGNTIDTVPDGVIDSSGSHFVNLTNLLNTRDNLRQAVSDLFALTFAIEEGQVTDGATSFDASKIYYYGFSLGGIAGTVFTAMEPNVRDEVLVFTGTSAVKILDGSFNFGPALHAGLAANGVVKGTPEYEQFMAAAQTIVDSGDSVNFATAAAQGRGTLFMELVGGNSSPSDLTVPNVVPDANDTTGTVPAPLAGTEPQLALMGLTHVNTDQGMPGGTDLKVVTKFTSGEHGSLIDPTPDPAVTTEMQSQAATFFATDGTFLDVTNDTVLQAPPAP